MALIKEGNRWVNVLAVMALVRVISLFKISYVVGSQVAFFTGSAVAVPLVGVLAGPFSSLAFFLIRCGTSLVMTKTISLHLLAFVVPGLCASWYLTTQSSMVRLWLPIACMVVFAVHPVGAQAFPYALYWLIPVVLYFIKPTHFFFQALGSTFVAHAVGSIIWLYTVPMSASQWLGLIPVVAVERMMYAFGMVAIWYAYRLAAQSAVSVRAFVAHHCAA